MIKKRILCLVLAFLFVFPLGAFAETTADESEQIGVAESVLNYVQRVYNYDMGNTEAIRKLMKLYLEKEPDGFEKAMDAVMTSLDEYSMYFNPEEFQEFYNNVESEFAGMGAYLSRVHGYITISGVMPGSPAEKAALTEGDKIVKVDGEDMIGVDSDYCISKIRGEKGTEVILTIERDRVGTFDVKIVRDTVKGETVSSQVLDSNIGYINISGFSSSTGEEFGRKISEFDDLGISRIIIDLRYNGGGVTDQAYACLSYLIPKDAVMCKVKYKAGTEVYGNTKSDRYKKRSVVVLVNGSTASASEILTAAVKDNQTATVIGEKTYGKGTMQNMVSLGEYGGIKVTVAEFFGPNDTVIKDTGISPDISVTNLERLAKKEDFETLKFDRIYKKGDDSEQVLAIKQRLMALKYYNGTLDNYYDESLHQAVKTFQEINGLYPYGEADITTQTIINNLVQEAYVTEDTQLSTAIEFLKDKAVIK